MTTMIFRRPSPPLDRFVEILWYYADYQPTFARETLLPHGQVELVIPLEPTTSSEATGLLAGPQSRATVIEPSGASPLLGAHFAPGGAGALFGYPSSDFRDLDIPLVDLMPKFADSVVGPLHEVADPHQALALLERQLMDMTTTAPAPHPAVDLAVHALHRNDQLRTIRSLVDESGLSHRRFTELFRSEIGLTPKLYARIQRFQQTLRRIATTPRIEWAYLAATCGYADQAHLIREFRTFANLTPASYLPRWPEHPNHVLNDPE